MLVKPAVGFLTRDADAVLVQDVTTIINSMTGNDNFPTPNPALSVITTANNAFAVAIADSALGGVEETVLKNMKRAELTSLVRQLSVYVLGACGGDMAKLLSSGFPVQKPTRTPVGPLPTPRTPVLVRGGKGQLYAAGAPINGAYSYGWRLALASDPTKDVQAFQTTSSRTTFDGLTPGAVYEVQLSAVGSAGETDWSNAASLMVA